MTKNRLDDRIDAGKIVPIKAGSTKRMDDSPDDISDETHWGDAFSLRR
ncbi:hypothetical protein ZOD2009_10525 [Haladaptatus paucihalophilus DX253]|uniref:Uncharacterized protein n=1 Tax=Haladaptatus paucihalophilus DX253 TaxID=797209 RepID=E7QTH7_HALPU|nr:hypothetical protein ZOD2009_10525 [Haladaptatus paucihalophilus DX253]